jgi:DNA polymerase I
MILKDGKHEKALSHVQKIIKELIAKKVPIEKLIIRTQLSKAIDEYENIGPHVVVAQRMQELGLPVRAGSMIEFVIAKGEKKSLVREKAKLPEEVKEGQYDVDYYLDHQIIPAIENIFSIFGVSREQLIQKQKNLMDF